jgi:hypothetical protein
VRFQEHNVIAIAVEVHRIMRLVYGHFFRGKEAPHDLLERGRRSETWHIVNALWCGAHGLVVLSFNLCGGNHMKNSGRIL